MLVKHITDVAEQTWRGKSPSYIIIIIIIITIAVQGGNTATSLPFSGTGVIGATAAMATAPFSAANANHTHAIITHMTIPMSFPHIFL